MSDIVERLRVTASAAMDASLRPRNGFDWCHQVDDDCTEAAAEIEQLRYERYELIAKREELRTYSARLKVTLRYLWGLHRPRGPFTDEGAALMEAVRGGMESDTP